MGTAAFLSRSLGGAMAAGLLSVALLSGASAQEITITHPQGETILPSVPEKVLVFDLATLDTLDALGVPVAGVPTTNYPQSLAKYGSDDYIKIGSLFEPDYEVVAAEAPDLIIVAGRSAAAYPELAKIAPTVDLSNDWLDFEGTIRANAEKVGEIFGKQTEVAALLADLDAAIADSKAAAEGKGNGLVVMTSGGKVTAFGPGSRFGWVHEAAGLAPVIEDVEAATHGEAISNEFLLETNPDWLFVIDRDAGVGGEAGQSAHAVLDNELVHQTKAWQNQQISYIDPIGAYIVNGGVRNFTNLVKAVGAAFAE